jgi:ABC-type phosphate/phosphonate transport system substrate-binding protein
MIQRRLTLASLALLVAALVQPCWAADDEATPTERVKIGMAASLFKDIPEPLVAAMMRPFSALMESQTGVPGDLVPGGDARHLGQLLAANEVQIGVFHGVEFAWARQKYPQLKPLMIAVNQQRHVRACIVVRTDSKFERLADLRGKELGYPKQSREHCQLFFERRCHGCTAEAAKFFKSVPTPANTEDALDDVVDQIIPAALVDAVALECYQRRKPGRASQLRTIETSEIFPSAAVAYAPGVLDEETLDRFRAGLISARNTAMGRQFMTLWKLTAFEPVPPDYEATLSAIVKAYPYAVPEAKKPVSLFPALFGAKAFK